MVRRRIAEGIKLEVVQEYLDRLAKIAFDTGQYPFGFTRRNAVSWWQGSEDFCDLGRWCCLVDNLATLASCCFRCIALMRDCRAVFHLGNARLAITSTADALEMFGEGEKGEPEHATPRADRGKVVGKSRSV